MVRTTSGAQRAETERPCALYSSLHCHHRRDFFFFKTTPQFRAALRSNGVKGHSHALLAGNTDGIQPVDGGVGALLKRESEDVFGQWCEDEANWKEWSDSNMPAWRKRAALTQWYGVAWERVCRSFPFEKVTLFVCLCYIM